MGKRAGQMRDRAFFVLVSLLDGPKRGDAIIKVAAELSEGQVRLVTGTLYAELERLIAEGHVNVVREEIANGRERRWYGLAPLGAGPYRAEAEQMADAARLVTKPAPESEPKNPEGEARLSSLERRCRWLLLAYPAWYRRKRAEEMLGTLLETNTPDQRWPSFRDAQALALRGLSMRGWLWPPSILWAVLGAGGAGYILICTMLGCTTNLCTTDEFLLPQYNGEPDLIIAVGGFAAVVWVLFAVPMLIAGFVWLRGWRLRNWLRAAAWAGAWVSGLALMGLAVFSGLAWADGSGAPNVAWGELPICVAWVALGAVINQILSTPPRLGVRR